MLPGPPSIDPVDPTVLELALRARQRNLVIYAGAGLSIANPTCLPSGATLAAALHDWLDKRPINGLLPYDRASLLSIADAVEATPGGRALLQRVLPDLAPYDKAHPNLGHRTLAALLLEGAVEVLTTNWDTCIERAIDAGDRIEVIVHNQEYARVVGPRLMKVHGCVRRLDSLLVSTADLQTNAPLWVGTTLAPQLALKTIAFVGIGDIADYVRIRIRELLKDAGTKPDVRVVSPSIVSDWDTSQWASLTEADITPDKRIPQTADDFLTALLGAYVNDILSTIDEMADALAAVQPDAAIAKNLIRGLGAMSGLKVLYWLRSVRIRLESGQPADSDHLRAGVIALGMRLGASGEIRPHGIVRDGQTVWRLAVADGVTVGPRFLDLMEQELSIARSRGDIDNLDEVRVVYAGVRGPLLTGATRQHVIPAAEFGDVISAVSQEPQYLAVDEILGGVA